MTTEQLILQELQKLTRKVESLEKELAQLKNSRPPIFALPNKEPIEQINPFKPKGGDPWGRNGEIKIEPKLIDGHDALFMPFEVEESEASKKQRETLIKWRNKVEELLEYWKQNPDKAPQYGAQNECAKCSLKLDNGPLSYSCPNNDCPCGMGPTTC